MRYAKHHNNDMAHMHLGSICTLPRTSTWACFALRVIDSFACMADGNEYGHPYLGITATDQETAEPTVT